MCVCVCVYEVGGDDVIENDTSGRCEHFCSHDNSSYGNILPHGPWADPGDQGAGAPPLA